MLIKVGYHQPVTSPRERTGALINYFEIAGLMSVSATDITPVPHDIFELIQWSSTEQSTFFAGFSEADVIVSNVGPYAHLYHYLREKHNGRFRIIRDVRTSAWAGYLYQELLCAKLTLPGDLVLFPSEFCRQFFIQSFPVSLSVENTAVCYPLQHFFPKNLPPHVSGRNLRLGYIGRISRDKNVDQLLNIFFALHNQGERNVELHLAGSFDGKKNYGYSSIGSLMRMIKRHGISSEKIVYHGLLPHKKIWKFLRSIDVFLFPAVSSVESFGRVLLEAQHAGVPTIAADYAAAPELLPATNLVEVDFFFDQRFSVFDVFSMGRINEQACLNNIFSVKKSEVGLSASPYEPRLWFDYLRGRPAILPLGNLSSKTQAYLAALEIHGLDYVGDKELFSGIESSLDFFRYFNDNSKLSRILLALKSSVIGGGYPGRRMLYLSRLPCPSRRMAMGYALEHAWHSGFRAQIQLNSQQFLIPTS